MDLLPMSGKVAYTKWRLDSLANQGHHTGLKDWEAWILM